MVNEGAALRDAGAKFSRSGGRLAFCNTAFSTASFSRLAKHVHVDSWLLFAPKYISADGVSSSGILAPSMVALCARCKSPQSHSQQPAVDPRRARTAITSDLSRHLLRQHGSTDGSSR